MLKKPAKALIITFVSIFALYIFKDVLIKSVVTAASSRITGAKVTIGGFSLGLFRQSVRIRDMRVYNPKGFSRSVLVQLPRVDVDYDLASLMRGTLHLRRVNINLKELVLEKNKEGKLNVDSLAVAKGEPGMKEEKGRPRSMPMQIDEISLLIGRIISKDYAGREKPVISVYELNIDKTYRNITSAQQLVLLIIAEPLKAAGIKGAGIYGIAVFTGVGAIPVAVGTTLFKKDTSEAEFKASQDAVFEAAIKVAEKNGRVISQDRQKGLIRAKVSGTNISIGISRLPSGGSLVTVSARKYFIPKPELASGLLYEIQREIK